MAAMGMALLALSLISTSLSCAMRQNRSYWVYESQKQYAPAMKQLKCYLNSENPADADVLFHLGVCYYHQAQYDASIHFFKSTINWIEARHPNLSISGSANFKKAVYFYHDNTPDSAAVYFAKSIPDRAGNNRIIFSRPRAFWP